MTLRRLTVLLLLAACGSRPDRQRELAACQLISKSGDELARCLILKYNWGADGAGPAKTNFQWTLDSIRIEHEKQAEAVVAREQARSDSIAAVQHRTAIAQAARQRRLDAIDSVFWHCDSEYSIYFTAHGGEQRRDSGRAVCLKARDAALRRAGFPANALPQPEP